MAVDPHDEPIGYVVVEIVDGCAHVEQMTVHPSHQGQGLGGRLLAAVEQWARRNDMRALTLTTFADVAWNGPLYLRLGFRVLANDELGPELRSLCAVEARHGLDPGLRVCMRRELDRT